MNCHQMNCHCSESRDFRTLKACKICAQKIKAKHAEFETASIQNLTSGKLTVTEEATIKKVLVDEAHIKKITAEEAEISLLKPCLIADGFSTALQEPIEPILRDQFSVEGIVSLTQKLVEEFYGNRTFSSLVIPTVDWTGNKAVDAAKNFPTSVVTIKSPIDPLSLANFVRTVLSMTWLVIYEIEPQSRRDTLSTDVKNLNFDIAQYAPYVRLMVQLLEQITLDIQTNHLSFQTDVATRDFYTGLLTVKDFFVTLANIYETNDTNRTDASFYLTYVGPLKRQYDQLYNWHLEQGFCWGYGALWHQDSLPIAYWGFLAAIPPPNEFTIDQWKLTENQIRMIPVCLMSDARVLKRLVDDEAIGATKYFWSKFLVSPVDSTSQLWTAPQDPEGWLKNSGFSFGNWDSATFDYIFQCPVPFRELRVLDSGGAVVLSYDSSEGYENETSFVSMVKSVFPEGNPEGDQILCQIEQIWNHYIQPQYVRLVEVIGQRIANCHDHFYCGGWAAPFADVKKVDRLAQPDPNQGQVFTEKTQPKSYTFTIPYPPDESKDVKIPVNAANNALLAAEQFVALGTTEEELIQLFEEQQEKTRDMDQWLRLSLSAVLGLNNGSAVTTLKKIDPTKNITRGNPYTSLENIFENYAAESSIIDNSSENSNIESLVFQSGRSLEEFFYDIREFYLNLWVVENFAGFNFAAPQPILLSGDPLLGGVLIPNQDGVNVTFRVALNGQSPYTYPGINTLAVRADSKSDLQALNRHYGYDESGNVYPPDWETPTKLKHQWLIQTAPVGGPVNLVTIDYVHREHYPITPGNFLPSNDRLPGKPLFYQYTDPGDELLRENFLAEFQLFEANSTSKLDNSQLSSKEGGTFYRWKFDWVVQHMLEFVVQQAGDAPGKQILPQDFLDQYYTPFVINTASSIPDPLPSKRVYTRMISNLQGSASSQSIVDKNSLTIIILVRFATLNPARTNSIHNQLSTILHEVALGHGFDDIPNNIDFLNGIDAQTIWTSTNGYPTVASDTIFGYMPSVSPGVVGEGWATFGEIVGVQKGLYVKIDPVTGKPLNCTVDTSAISLGMSSLSRIASRQVISVAENFSAYAWPLFRCIEEFEFATGILLANGGANFGSRFIRAPMQQTSYAAGLVTNLSLQKAIEKQLQDTPVPGKPYFSFAEYVKFRIYDSDQLFGGTLLNYTLPQYQRFATATAPVPPCV